MRLEIPSRLDELTIPVYRRVMSLNEEKQSDSAKAERLVSLLAGIPISEIRKMTQKSFDKVGRTIAQMKPVEKSYALDVFYEHDGIQYGFIPNLDKITVGEMTDLEFMCSDTTANLEKIMSVLYRPVTERHGPFYSVKDYEGVNEKPFLEMPIRQAMGALNFFFHLGLASLSSINSSFKEEKEEG